MARKNTCQQSAGRQEEAQDVQGGLEIVGGVELAKHQQEIQRSRFRGGEAVQVGFERHLPRRAREPRLEWFGAADHHSLPEWPADEREALREVLHRPLRHEQLFALPPSAGATKRQQAVIEQWVGHGLLCGGEGRGTSGAMMMTQVVGRGARAIGRLTLDFALPPRCAGCGAVTAEVGLFCPECWPKLHFLSGGCQRCGHPLEATEADTCGACHKEDRPALDRIRAAVAYGDIPRSLAIRLKYGRKTALARTMASYMRRSLGELSAEAVLAPVPLHRWRLWSRGFNQAQLIAAALGREVDPTLLRRTKRTPRLKGLNPSERRKLVSGAFDLRPGKSVKGRHVILVDDVFTTGATAEACARLLKRKGAARVELIAWARVLR